MTRIREAPARALGETRTGLCGRHCYRSAPASRPLAAFARRLVVVRVPGAPRLTLERLVFGARLELVREALGLLARFAPSAAVLAFPLREVDAFFPVALCRRLRVVAAFFAEARRCAAGRARERSPPIRPPRLLEVLLSGTPRPLPDRLPPPLSLLTVAHARRSASSFGSPRDS